MLLGFHGTAAGFRESLLAGIDPNRNTTFVRGQGFYLCSRQGAGSLADQWAGIKAGNEVDKLILGVFLKNPRDRFIWLEHYDRGKMELENKVEETGLEMVVYAGACALIHCGEVTPRMEAAFPWDHCPKSRVTEYIGKGIRAVTPRCLQWDPTERLLS